LVTGNNIRYRLSGLVIFFGLYGSPKGDALDSTVASKRTIILYQDDVAQLVCGGVVPPPMKPIADAKEIVHYTINFDLVFDSKTRIGFKTENISPALVHSAFRFYKDDISKMANPGESFNATDEFLYPGLPFQRLILSGKSGVYSFVYLEQGGIGYSTVFYLLKGKDYLFKEEISSKLSSASELKAYFAGKYQK
jgi:hypothetical protein